MVDYGAQEGKELIAGIINSDEYAAYLGECALVPNNSPISNTKLVYGNTLLDENASCHLALGAGFTDCLKNHEALCPKELLEQGINPSKNHVDFMIGTPDLNIEAETKKGPKLIFKNGEFNIWHLYKLKALCYHTSIESRSKMKNTKKKRTNTLIIIVAIIFILSLGAAMIILLKNDDKKDSSQDKTSSTISSSTSTTTSSVNESEPTSNKTTSSKTTKKTTDKKTTTKKTTTTK